MTPERQTEWGGDSGGVDGVRFGDPVGFGFGSQPGVSTDGGVSILTLRCFKQAFYYRSIIHCY